MVTHPSQRLAGLCSIFVIGLGFFVYDDQLTKVLGVGLILLVFWRLGWRLGSVVLFLGATLAFGRMLIGSEITSDLPAEKYGIVVDQPQYYSDHVQVIVRVGGGIRWATKVKNRFLELGMGDRVVFSCENEWDESPVLQAWNVKGGCEIWDLDVVERVGPPLSWLTTLRFQMKQSIRRMFPEPAAALVIGMTIGEEGGLPESLRETFRDVGLTHLVALSGFNVTLLFGWMASLSRLLVVRPRMRVTLLLIGGFVFLSFIGWQPSLLRATVMGSLAAVGASLGRKNLTVHLLLIAATLMAISQPSILGSIGFLLSAGSTLGLILWAEAYTGFWNKVGFPRVVAEPLGLTSAAMVAVSPILVGVFGQAAPAALPANLLAGPLVPIIMTGGLVGFVPEQVAAPFVPVPYIAATATARIATAASYIPNPFHEIGPWPIEPHWYGLVLIIILVWIELKPLELSCSSS